MTSALLACILVSATLIYAGQRESQSTLEKRLEPLARRLSSPRLLTVLSLVLLAAAIALVGKHLF